MKTRYVVCTDDEMEYIAERFIQGYVLVNSIDKAYLYKTKDRANTALFQQGLRDPKYMIVKEINIC